MIPGNNNEVERGESSTKIVELNEISADWSASDGLPDDVYRERVETICHSIADGVDDTVDGLKENTTLSEFEAHVWALDNVVDKNGVPLTHDAIAIYLTIMSEAGGWLSPEGIVNAIDSARSKYDDAKEMVGEITFPNRDDELQSPHIVWLSYHTIADLRSLAEDGETTLDEIVSRLANDAKTVMGIREFAREYLDARGKESVAQLAVGSELLANGVLALVSHTSAAGEPLPEVVTETDAVEVDGQQFDLAFEEVPDGPGNHTILSLYASENIINMEAVDLETGLDDLKAAISETQIDIVELVDLARHRMDAKVVTATPRKDYLLVEVFLDGESEPGTDRFHHIQEVQIEDKVYPANVRQYYRVQERPSETVLWSAGDSDGVDEVSVEEGIESLQVEEFHEGDV